MGIDRQSESEGSLQIGPTSLGMVRIWMEQGGVEIAMDFTPEEAEEIAEELKAAARKRGAGGKAKPRT